MGYHSHPGTSALPRTFVGRWLRAGMLDRREERDRLVRTLNCGNARGWNDDEPAVVQAAAELVLRRYFGPADPASDEIVLLAHAVTVGLSKITRPLSQQHADEAIRSALGGPSLRFDALTPGDRHVLRAAIVTIASVMMEVDEATVDEVLREAERLAFERGFHPPLVPRGWSARGACS